MPILPREERQTDRFEVNGDVLLKVYLTKTNDVQEVEGRLVNAGPGGLFIEVDKPDIPIGALADLQIKLEGKPLANTLGLVRWLLPNEGAGIEFFYTTDEERGALQAYLREWEQASLNRSSAG